MEAYARVCRCDALIESSRLQEAVDDVDRAEVVVHYLQQPFYEWLVPQRRTGLALLHGELDRAEQLIEQTRAVGTPASDQTTTSVYLAQLCLLRIDQDRCADMVEPLADIVDRQAAFPAWRAVLALALCELGRLDEARGQLDVLAARDFLDHPRHSVWRTGLHACAVVAVAVHDQDRARKLRALLEPSRGRIDWFGGGSLGPTDLVLGQLAAAGEDLVSAPDLLQSRHRAVPHRQRPRLSGRSLLGRARVEPDPESARVLAVEAHRIAVGIGMPQVAREASALL